MFPSMSGNVMQSLFGSSFTAAAAAPPAEQQKKTVVAAPYSNIGAWAEEILYGKKGVGAYATDHTGTLKAKTTSGFSITGSTTKSGATGGLSANVKAASPLYLPLLIKKKADGKRTISVDARPRAEREVEGTVPNVNMTASLASNGKLNVDMASKIVGGATATVTTTIMPPSAPSSDFLTTALWKAVSKKLTLECAGNKVNANVNSTLEAKPVIGLTAASGIGNMIFGADMKFETAKALSAANEAAATVPSKGQGSAAPGTTPAARAAAALVGGMSSWTLGTNYTYDVHQVAAFLSNGAKASKTSAPTVKAKLAYGWKMSDKSSLAMELGQEVSLAPLYSAPAPAVTPSPTFSVGVSTKVPGDALAKWRVDSNGMVSLHYSDVLMVPGGPPLAVSASAVVNGLQPFAKPPRVGLTAELA